MPDVHSGHRMDNWNKFSTDSDAAPNYLHYKFYRFQSRWIKGQGLESSTWSQATARVNKLQIHLAFRSWKTESSTWKELKRDKRRVDFEFKVLSHCSDFCRATSRLSRAGQISPWNSLQRFFYKTIKQPNDTCIESWKSLRFHFLRFYPYLVVWLKMIQLFEE